MIAPLSAVESFVFRGRNFFVKRDDQIDPLLSGNKYRKLYTLLHTPLETYTDVISYGGVQSNAMLSIAALCRQKGWTFHYTSKTVPTHLKAQPTGNLKMALELGMRLHEVPPKIYSETVRALPALTSETALLIPQGGADPMAKCGVDRLAEEIALWQQEEGVGKLSVVIPSGTGTTAYYLARALRDVQVITTAAVGDNAYLRSQMTSLGPISDNLQLLPPTKKYHFGKPYAELLSIYRELHEAGIEFDLLYAAKMWQSLMEQVKSVEGTILYIHSGGIIGNETLLQRYAYKGFL